MKYIDLKIGFEQYLRELLKDNKTSENTEIPEEISIFDYIEEFSKYVGEELDLDPEEISQTFSELENLEFIDGQLVLNDENSIEDLEEEEQNAILGILNNLIQDEEFSDLIDKNDTEGLDKDDVNQFLTALKEEYNKNGEDISLKDMATALVDIKNDDFEYTQKEEKIEEPKEIETTSSTPTVQNTGGNLVSTNKQPSPTNSSNDTDSNKNLSLEEQRAKKLDELADATQEANEIRSGNHQDIKTAEENGQAKIDEAQAQYDLVVQENEEKLGELTSKREEKLTSIQVKEKEITDTQNLIKEAEVAITIFTSEISINESNLASLQASASSLRGQESSADEDKKATIAGKLSEIEGQISAINSALTELRAALENAKTEKETQETNLQTKQTELEILNSEKETIEQDMYNALDVDGKNALMEAINAQEQAKAELKTNVESVKSQLLETAEAKINGIQQEIAALDEQIKIEKQQEAEKMASLSPLDNYNKEYGENLAAAALSLFPNAGFGGYCAAGVSDSLVKGTGKPRTYGNGCDYQNVMRERDDFEEYTDFDWDSMNGEEVVEYLKTFPAGTVVSFGSTSSHPYGHVMILDGNGHEISDGNNDITDYYKRSYSSMAIFIPVG